MCISHRKRETETGVIGECIQPIGEVKRELMYSGEAKLLYDRPLGNGNYCAYVKRNSYVHNRAQEGTGMYVLMRRREILMYINT